MALFLSVDGRVLGPTARTIWDQLIALEEGVQQVGDGLSDAASAIAAYETSRKAAENHGAVIFDELMSVHREATRRERKKGTHAFAGRRRAIERLGLAQVRAHRLAQLAADEQEWSVGLAAREAVLPELTAIALVRVGPQEQP
jgi:hypothetical protein